MDLGLRLKASKSSSKRSCSITALVLGLLGCVGNAPMETALDQPVPSDHGRFSVTVTVPTHSLQRGANQFVVQVRNQDETPGTLTHVTAIMPAHGHTANLPTITEQGTGRFDVRDLDLVMPGQWQVTLTLSRTGATDDDQATVWANVP